MLTIRVDKVKGELQVNDDNSIAVVTPAGWVDTPVRHGDGRLVWDFPERVSDNLKDAVVRQMNSARNKGTPYKNDLFAMKADPRVVSAREDDLNSPGKAKRYKVVFDDGTKHACTAELLAATLTSQEAAAKLYTDALDVKFTVVEK